ncbi:MAG: tetratricopeptide repeat protein, partial [Polyangiaceae bacterium]
AVAGAREDANTRDRLAVYAAERAPEDAVLVRKGDEAVRRLNDEALTARFEKKVPSDARAQALLTYARELVQSGKSDMALGAYERATQLLPADERDPVLAEIRGIYESLGSEEDFEARALREAADESLTAAVRADRFTQVAHLREKRSDLVGATHALLDAARTDPSPLVRWSAVERAAELAQLAGIRVSALREIESRVADEVRPAVLRRLARALEEVGDIEAALACLERVLAAEPDDEEADRAIEVILVGRNDYPRLVAYLAGKAARLGRMDRRDALRAVRLRRAAILEQRLGRVEEACAELERLLRDWPDNETALRYLADLYERSGQMGKAAPLLRHLSELAHGPQTQADLELRAAIAMRDAGNHPGALVLVREILSRDPENVDAHVLWVDLARKAGDPIELGNALEASARVQHGRVDAMVTSDLWVEAAQASSRAGDNVKSLARAKRAAEEAPGKASAQLFARGLEYRMRGAGTLQEASATLDDLARIVGALDAEDVALKTFLVAEALSVLGR